MREIIFRGKRLDTGEWVEGSLLIVTMDGGTYPIIFNDHFVRFGNEVKAVQHSLVDPETIGQYIGMNDSKGKRIFECDVLIVTRYGEKYLSVVRDIRDLPGVMFGSSVESIRITGNIYDNPELLEKEG